MAITTKEQERKALEQIRKIVANLGEDSYVAIALEGCLEIAEENIENDFACSLKQQVRSLEDQVANLKHQLDEEHKDWEAAHAAAHEVADEKDAEIARLTTKLDDATQIARWNAEQCGEARQDAAAQEIRVNEAETRATVAESEVVCLKAKLYDFMTAAQN